METALMSPQDRVKQNAAVVAATSKIVNDNYVVRVQGRSYLMVAGAQAVATSMGYTTAVEAVRYVPATEGLAGYWEATASVLADGKVVGRGIGCVFDDEPSWKGRPQFARQMMAQTRATGRALKGVMGWATALLGTETSLHEEMPADGPTTAQEAPAAPKRLPAPSKPAKAAGGKQEAFQELRGVLTGVQEKVSKAGKTYWRIGLEAGEGQEWFTSFQPVEIANGERVVVVLEPYGDGVKVRDCYVDPAAEEVPF
jgi:hypothetical protein